MWCSRCQTTVFYGTYCSVCGGVLEGSEESKKTRCRWCLKEIGSGHVTCGSRSCNRKEKELDKSIEDAGRNINDNYWEGKGFD